jgi:hypothetical protein
LLRMATQQEQPQNPNALALLTAELNEHFAKMAEQISALAKRQEQTERMYEKMNQKSQMTPATSAVPTEATKAIEASGAESKKPLQPDEVAKLRKPVLPDPGRFGGERNKFRAWKLEMEAKLKIDGPAIGDHHAQFAYLFSRLDSKAQAMTAAFYESGGYEQNHNPTKFMTYLEQIYGDPNIHRRAAQRLRTLRQGEKESFAAFLPRFEKELADSALVNGDDRVPINYLEGALNTKMRELMITMGEYTTYSTYVNALLTIGSKLDGLKVNAKPEYGRCRNDEMDWEPTKAYKIKAKTGEKRARWVDKDVMEERRQKGLCFRCGKKGHILEDCELLPALPPNAEHDRRDVRQKDARNGIRKKEPSASQAMKVKKTSKKKKSMLSDVIESESESDESNSESEKE